LWTATTGAGVESSPTVVGGVVYVGSLDHSLYAFDAGGITSCAGTPKTCAPLWTATTGAGVFSSPAVAGGVVYVGSFDGKLYAFDAAGTTNCAAAPTVCSPLWTAALTPGLVTSSPTVVNGLVFVGSGSGDHQLYAFDATGTTHCSGAPKACSPVWTGETGIGVRSSVAVAGDTVYVGTDNAVVSAFKLAPTGYVVAFGPDDLGSTHVPAGLSGVTAVAAGASHSLALRSDGTVVAWGRDVEGQTDVPAGLGGVKAISAGNLHSEALRSDGTVLEWGATQNGLPNSPSITGLTAISAGGDHSIGLKSDGTVVEWNLDGVILANAPTGLSGVTRVAAGYGHSLALKADGTVVAWGQDGYGQADVPAGLSGVKAIAAGNGDHSLALKSDGTVVAWGRNDQGQATVTPGLTGVVAVGGGEFDSLALKAEGTVVVWGGNSFGQRNLPLGLRGVMGIAEGGAFHLALVADGTPPATGLPYHPVAPARILDTRTGTGAPVGKLGPASTLALQVTGQGGVPSSGVAAVVLNVTVTGPTADSFLTAWPAGQAQPLASNLNFLPGQTVPNLVTVKVGDAGKVNLFNNRGSTDVVADVAGWYGTDALGAGSGFTTLAPARILDTRSGVGAPAAKRGPGSTLALQVTGVGGVPSTGVSAIVLNVTVTGPTAESFLTAWPAGQAQPLASNLNFLPGQSVPNLVTVKVGDAGKVNLYNNLGSTDVVADVAGWFSADGSGVGSAFVPVVPARVLDTRAGVGATTGKLGAAGTLALHMVGAGGVPATGASAVVLNVTATQPTAESFLTAWPAGQPLPLASNLNYVAGQTVPNLVTVKVGVGGVVDLYNNLGSTHVVADVAGWYTT
jgi:outer membrane protein assembly factor BamB